MNRRTVLKLATSAVALPAPRAKKKTAVTPLTGLRTLPSGRTYWLSGTGGPLVLGFPGSNLPASNLNDGFWNTGNPATTGWQRHSITTGYTLALCESYAPASNSSWNVGGGWPSGTQDDLAYALQVVADAGTFDAVYAAGFSAGGAMAWRVCADRPDVFRACFSGAGWAPVYPTTPIDCWHVHGGVDTTVPVRGGHVAIFPYTFPPMYQEGSMTTRDSLIVPEFIPTMGHATPTWSAARAHEFFTR